MKIGQLVVGKVKAMRSTHAAREAEQSDVPDVLSLECLLTRSLASMQQGRLDEGLALLSLVYLEDVYEDWSSLQREQLSRIYFTMCQALTEHYLAQQCYDEAVKWATTVLNQNRCDETAHRHLMQIYAYQGQTYQFKCTLICRGLYAPGGGSQQIPGASLADVRVVRLWRMTPGRVELAEASEGGGVSFLDNRDYNLRTSGTQLSA